MIAFKFFLVSDASKSAIVGSSMVETEFVIADGNRMQGNAMPVSTPYILRESEEGIPNACNLSGMEMASILCKMFNNVLLAVNGIASEKSSFP